MLYFFEDLHLSGFRSDVRELGESCNMMILPFMQSSAFFMRIFFLDVAYYYSNVPFTEKKELYFLCRVGRKRWGRRNLFYLAASAGILTFSLFLISIIQTASVGELSLSWDSVYKTLALTGGSRLRFPVTYAVMEAYEPFTLLLYVLVMDWLVILFIGNLMYAAGLYGYRIISGTAALLIVFLSALDVRTGGAFVYYSPVSWTDCKNWRIGFDNTRPDLPYMFTAIVFLNILLIMLAQRQVQKMEWNTEDE